MIKNFFLPLILICVFACREQVYEIEASDIEKISFQELPDTVRTFITFNIDSISNSKSDIFYSIDQNIEFTYGRGGNAKNWIGSINSNYHHFFIEGTHYRLKGNKGHPFIYLDEFLYFCDLNINQDDFLGKQYFKVKVPN